MSLAGTVARYADAWNDHDPVEAARCFTPGGARIWRVRAPARLPGEGFPTFRGREAIASAIAAFMDSVPDLRLDIEALSEGSDERLWTEWRLTGTHRATLGDWVARGERVEVAGVSIFRIARGGIREERAYWDSMLLSGPPPASLRASSDRERSPSLR